MSARVYSRCTVASVPRTETRRVTEAAQAGLIAGTVPTNGTVEFLAQVCSTMVDAVLQAMTTRSGRCASISSSISATTREISAVSLDRAVGKGRIVGDVEKIGVRPRRRHLAINGEAAEPGIEHQDVFRSAIARTYAKA